MSELLSGRAAPHLFEFVDRNNTDMPADYLPEAPGVLVTSELPNAAKLDGWRRHQPGDYRKHVGKHVLQVRQCGDSKSNHWTIERFEFFDYKGMEALVFPFGDLLIWSRTRQAAMRIAEHCYPTPLAAVGRWQMARACK
jgi:hypothetical protein